MEYLLHLVNDLNDLLQYQALLERRVEAAELSALVGALSTIDMGEQRYGKPSSKEGNERLAKAIVKLIDGIIDRTIGERQS